MFSRAYTTIPENPFQKPFPLPIFQKPLPDYCLPCKKFNHSNLKSPALHTTSPEQS